MDEVDVKHVIVPKTITRRKNVTIHTPISTVSALLDNNFTRKYQNYSLIPNVSAIAFK